jgi:TolA-binding protein
MNPMCFGLSLWHSLRLHAAWLAIGLIASAVPAVASTGTEEAVADFAAGAVAMAPVVEVAVEPGAGDRPARANQLQEQIEQRRVEAISRLERVVAAYPDDPRAAELQFQLAELLFAQERAEHLARFEHFDDFDDAALIPAYPRAKAIYRELLDDHAEAPEAAGALYGLAYCLQEEGATDAALDHYQDLVDRFPDSSYAPEAYMRMGEQQFDRNELAAAALAYRAVLQWPTSAFYEEALYKLGWTQYRLSDYESAISVFTYLIDDELEKGAASGMAGEAKSYIAISFSEFGGVERLAGYLQNIGDRPYGPELLLSVGGLFRGSGDFGKAEAAFRTFVAHYPEHEEAPDAQRQLVEVLEMQEEDEEALQARERYAELFGPGSAWAEKWQHAAAHAEIQQAAEDYLYTTAATVHKEAKSSGDVDGLRRAAGLYQIFVERFPQSPRILNVAMQRADAWVDLGEPLQAAPYYLQAAEIAAADPATTETAAAALYNAILVFDQAGAADDPAVFAQMTAAVDEFSRSHPDDPRLASVWMRRAEILFDREQHAEAAEGFVHVLELAAGDSDLTQRAEEMAARSYFKAGNYVAAERWSAELPDLPATRTLRVASVYQQGDALRADGDSLAAAAEFLRVVALDPRGDGADDALYDAAIASLNGGDRVASLRAFERLASDYPSSEFAADALRQAAILHEGRGEHAEAATLLEQLATREAGNPAGDDAQYFAALYWEDAGNDAAARAAFRTYRQSYTEKSNRTLEARIHEIRLAEEARSKPKEIRKLLTGLLSAAESYRARGESVSPLILAEAEWKRTELDYPSYTDYRIKKPLKKRTQRKEEKMNALIDGYLRVAEYGAALWSVRSLTRVGEALEEFRQALLTAPLPDDLTEVEAALYTMELEDYVQPYSEQAAESYMSALEIAAEGRVEDAYTLRAQLRLASLQPDQPLPALPGDGPPPFRALAAATLADAPAQATVPAIYTPGRSSDGLDPVPWNGASAFPGSVPAPHVGLTSSAAAAPRWGFAGLGAAGGIATATFAAQGGDSGAVAGLGAASAALLGYGLWPLLHQGAQKSDNSKTDFSGGDSADDLEIKGPKIIFAPDRIGLEMVLPLP